jgi:2-keto-4-pentenoate hydratase/2-oxohepta-3-ene-1,7-dioic acid hydratase in catechol pathway
MIKTKNIIFIAITVFLLSFSSISLAASKKIARFQNKSGDILYGLVVENNITTLGGDFNEIANGRFRTTDKTYKISDVKLLAPVQPSKVINFGWTYPKHAKEVGGESHRKEPLVFLKPPTVITNPDDPILYPKGMSERVEFEGELAIIIGKKAKNVSPRTALKYVLGYTCFNDVTARDLTKKDPQFTRGKGFDTFGPLGPWIVTDIDPSNLKITTKLNGIVKQNSSTSNMTFGIPFLISYISKVMTLNPGDVIATGTPGGSKPMKPGDVVEVEIEKIGILKNKVK